MANKSTSGTKQKKSQEMAATLPIKRANSLFDELNQMQSRIMKRAYEIFDGNGHATGRDLDDWLKAEEELVWKPAIELEEKDNKFLLQMAVPGVESKDIDIQVTPEEILVQADLQHKHEETKGKVYTCEFESGNLFRSVRLPEKIDPKKVKAELKDGLLQLTADVAQESQPRRVDLNAS